MVGRGEDAKEWCATIGSSKEEKNHTVISSSRPEGRYVGGGGGRGKRKKVSMGADRNWSLDKTRECKKGAACFTENGKKSAKISREGKKTKHRKNDPGSLRSQKPLTEFNRDDGAQLKGKQTTGTGHDRGEEICDGARRIGQSGSAVLPFLLV